jgi:serine protease Do
MRVSVQSRRLLTFAALLLVGLFCVRPGILTAQQASNSVQQLLDVESKVTDVVKNNLSAVVAIADGVGAGSGVVVTKEGLVLTAGHVMVGSGEYIIYFPDGRTARARPLGKNLDVDAGMVQIIDPGPWPFVKIGKAKSLQLGDWVVSMGHSGGYLLGRKPPVRTGRVLNFNETQIESDAVLIGGDSGGPLFNLDGALVGIHSSIGDSIAENRHVMTEVFERHYERMRRGEVWGQLPTIQDGNDGSKPPKMGVRINKESGVVTGVTKGSPAWNAGIEVDDIVRKFDDVDLTSGDHLIKLVKEKITGDVVRIVLERDGRLIEVEVRLR